MDSTTSRTFSYSPSQLAEKHSFAKKLGYTDFYDQCDQIQSLQDHAYKNGFFVGQAVQSVKRATNHDWSDLPQNQIATCFEVFKNLSRGSFGDPDKVEVTKEQTLKFLNVFRLAGAVYPPERYNEFALWFQKEWKRNFGDELADFLDRCISDMSTFKVIRPSFMPREIL